ncbi:hypothetical protein [Streptomyces albicerus]|uniref:hypothetical protein n=1 Tax=Streptomyces albicerus TaxID=2569859 RepID=UPI00124BB39E|nr:hypothetical protein [Streptomyces albicerus]
MTADPVRQMLATQRGIVRYQLPDSYRLDEAAPVNIHGLRSPLTPPAQPTVREVFDNHLNSWRAGVYGA